MPLPTTQWGNIGNPLQATSSTNPTADVYKAIPGQNATTPGSADGPILGNYQILADGTAVQFLQAYASTALNAAVKISTWENVFQVVPTAAVADLVVGVNDRCGIALTTAFTANNYGCTWFTMKGLALALTAASVAAGKVVAASATAGVLYGATAGTDIQGTIVNTVVVGGSQAVSPVFML